MTAKPRKPLLVNLTWAAVLVLAPATYFGSWLALHWMYGRGILDLPTAAMIEKTVFFPLRWYSGESGLPGGDYLFHLAERCIAAGMRQE